MKGISIVICCYNSSLRLPNTLNHIAKQIIPKNIKCELIIVDNASTDNTAIVARQEWIKYNLCNIGFRVIHQPIPGLSNARQKGVREAIYEIILFCDDDNWLDKNYVNKAFHLMNSDDKFGIIGGQSIAISDVPFPEWWDNFKAGYAVGRLAKQTGDITDQGGIWGAGMVTRKKLFLDSFDKKHPYLLLDRAGDKLSSGGDLEFCMRVRLKGFRLFYDETLVLKHYIPESRLTEIYRDRLYNGFKETGSVIQEYINQINIMRLTKSAKCKIIFKSVILLIICKMQLTKKWAIKNQVNRIYRISHIRLGKVDDEVIAVADFAFDQAMKLY